MAALAGWPYIPIFFVQVHSRPGFWRKLGTFAYSLILMEWLLVALGVIVSQGFLLGEELAFGVLFWFGMILMLLGLALHAWTGRLWGWKSLIGYSELRPTSGSQKLAKEGPFSIMRHPTYFAHTLMFVGIFLLTGFTGTGVLALIDFLSSYFVIIPLEERELLARFGDEYRKYKETVPKFLPRVLVALRRDTSP